jgi:hypothetical protein
MEGLIVLISLLGIGIFGFMIYYVFKQIQFFLTATNLYKTMIEKQETAIKLLIDIRNNAKSVNVESEAIKMLGNQGIEGVSEKQIVALIDDSLKEIKSSPLSINLLVKIQMVGVWLAVAGIIFVVVEILLWK